MKIKLFSIPISITSKSQALAEVSHWLREYKSVISSQLSVIGSKSAGSQSAGPKPINRKQTNLKLKTENRKPITGYPKIITTPNPEMIVAAQSDPEFLKALQGADLAIPDGVGIVWALKILGLKRPGLLSEGRALKNISRLSGIELMELLIGKAVKNGWKVMLLGGRPGIAKKAAERLMHQIRPGLAKQGRAFIQSIGGPQNIATASADELNNLINSINSFSPDLLFVAFGHGKQEKWLNVNRYRLKVGAAMGVGGAFDQIADPSLRPPAIINSIGLGWLYRLFREPWRWRRQLSLLKFAWMVVKTKQLQIAS